MIHRIAGGLLLATAIVMPVASIAEEGARRAAERIDWQWQQKIPLRDGVELNATIYRPAEPAADTPCVFTLTPYVSDSYHARGMYFAANGYVFLTIDVRGRGNSGGEFTPMLQEANDGHDVVEWLAGQPWCNGKVTMWGGSYAGYNQWATAKERPNGLVTIVPVASVKPGLDFPMFRNLAYSYAIQWLTFTAGKAGQGTIFGDGAFWASRFSRWYRQEIPFRDLDKVAGNPSPKFQEWVSHPMQDAYWDGYSPTVEQYAALDLPILSITGHYDADQPGALAYYREHMRHASEAARARHYLIIGPWDHPGTRTPQAEFGGLTFGAASVLDMNALHKSWYDWTMKSGARPVFLKDKVAFYMTGEEAWRYAPSLEATTARSEAFHLDSVASQANDVFASGSLASGKPGKGKPDRYTSDPRDLSGADAYESKQGELIDQSGILESGPQLLYHSAPFEADTDIAGFFRLEAWISIDQPDTDFAVGVYEITADNQSISLSQDALRARYRGSLREAKLATPGKVEKYVFEGFPYVARRIAKGSRLRLNISPINTPGFQKNYNTGGIVAEESARDARKVTVTLHHDAARPSALFVPIAAKSTVP